jgi:hypothetical protein
MILTQEHPESHRYGGVSARRPIEEAKRLIPVVDLADLLCGAMKLKRVGEKWVAHCPIPGHEDKTPSFVVYPETNSWYCFGACARGGDVVHLAAAGWGYGPDEMAMAAANLLHEFGHDIPSKPESWYRRQKRQQPVRDALDEMRVRRVRRRLMRGIVAPEIETIPDPDERAREADVAWRELEPVARQMVAHVRDEARR